jgi:phage terminase large subunit
MTEKKSAWSAFLQRYRDDPSGFSEYVIKMNPLPWQREVMDAIAAGERRISVRSGHGVGKSSCAASIILWYLLTRYPAKVVVTAPTASQLYDALFAEVKRRLKEMPPAISKLLEATSDRIVLKSSPTEAFCSARTSSKERPESLAGVHSEHVLLIADEASGIPEEVYESAAGSMSGHSATTLLLGNPTRTSGFFYRTHTDLKNDWWTKKVSCADSPLVSKDFIEDMAKRYGDESNAYRIRVLGEFPQADDDTFIPLNLIEAATRRDITESPTAGVIWGVDVARYGRDRSALAKRKGSTLVEEIKTWRDKSTMELAGIILNEYESTPIMDRPQEICVDVIGIGAGVVDRLQELDLPARGINVAESASMNQKYMRLRDELWGRARDWFEEKGCKLPDDTHLVQELAAPRFAFTSTGKIKIEGKDEMRKRGITSPDIADAFCLTFASNAIVGIHGNKYAWSGNIAVDTSYVV